MRAHSSTDTGWPGETEVPAGCQSPIPPASLQKGQLALTFGTLHSIEWRESEVRKLLQWSPHWQEHVFLFTVDLFLQNLSLLAVWNFLRALGLTSTPGSVELASCCGCLPVHPLVDLPWTRLHSVCALWPSCLYTLSDLTPWRLYLPSGGLLSLFVAICISWTLSSFGSLPRTVTLSCLSLVYLCPITLAKHSPFAHPA